MKKIRFQPNVPVEVRSIEQQTALGILRALHRYADTGEGKVKPLKGEFEGLLRLRVGNHRILFDETADTITVHRIRDRKRRVSLSVLAKAKYSQGPFCCHRERQGAPLKTAALKKIL